VISLVVIGILAIVAVVGWFKLRRHGQSDHAAMTWRPTDESFRDPSSGTIMRVWVDPADGSRHYVPEVPDP
jgi:hypothetical protein